MYNKNDKYETNANLSPKKKKEKRNLLPVAIALLYSITVYNF